MTESFFRNCELPCDPIYQMLCHPDGFEHLERARQLTETMWSACYEYIDQDAPLRARDDFQSVWWELYLATSFRRAGIELTSWDKRAPTIGIPDVVAINPRVWIEAVMPWIGEKSDQLKEPPPGEVYNVPHDQFVLRLTAAIQEKAKKFDTYIENGTVQPSEPMVIAVSGGRLPFKFSDAPVPRIVRALFGVGDVGVQLDVKSGEIVSHFVQHQDRVFKRAGAEVRTDAFLNHEYDHISAVLYSAVDHVNCKCSPGDDFILVHNPHARVPIAKSWLRTCDQYSVEENGIRRWRADSDAVGPTED